ncbi:hypothetical protein EXIGLDRAFT_758582 [Exidia glandulosa HHB12029]|uniref:Uncharacterized protein n=1 Tax=Exidia glandulosa HHB12029 TaxID=1314781 RepID=A0A165QZS0_EXIGL|nr:hypothetical protein EXIGLDRAFT_758582 [Exidia glandulosa HHB12029]
MAPASQDKATRREYKTLDASNIGFTVYQLLPSPNGKLLAVAGLHQVSVVVLPRPGYWKADASTVAVKSLTIGERHHRRKGSPRVVKLQWHPWGEHGATLLVGTADGIVREYDVSINPDEPQQAVSFVPPQTRSNKTFIADASTRELASFTLGIGHADWGPLTLYGLVKNGDVYAISPYLPARAAVPPSYIWSLEYYVREKLEAAHRRPGFAALYEQQLRYVSALSAQLHASKTLASSQPVVVTAPPSSKLAVARQGPFLFQPEPHELDGSPGGDAVDIVYLGLGARPGATMEGQTEGLGAVLISFQDGKVDVCVDLDKVEARWEHGQFPDDELPLLTVFETVDLGVLKSLKSSGMRPADITDALSTNFPLFVVDPLYSDTIYVYHAFGVHCLLLRRWVSTLFRALAAEDKGRDATAVDASLNKSLGTDTFCVLDVTTGSSHASTPVVGIAVSDNVYLPYSLVAVTSTLQCATFELALRVDTSLPPIPVRQAVTAAHAGQSTATEHPLFVSALEQQYTVPQVLARPRPTLPNPPAGAKELQVNPETLRLLVSAVEKIRAEIAQIRSAMGEVMVRVQLQRHEQKRQVVRTAELAATIGKLKSAGTDAQRRRLDEALERQRQLVGRLDRVVQMLMDAACPVLSEHETAWFEELKRHKRNVLDGDSGLSYTSRTESLESGFDVLLPELKTLTGSKQKKPSAPMGTSQALRIGRRLGEESKQIEELTDKLKDLCARVGVQQPASAA